MNFYQSYAILLHDRQLIYSTHLTNPPAPNADQPGFLTGRISSSAGDVSIRGKGNILRLGEEAEKINRITKPKN